jgi:murein DD-endopeptidase MepM/ murein hydrolase activator NlpD
VTPGSQPGAFEALLGIDLELRPGTYPLRWVGIGGQGRVFSKSHTVRVKKADFKTQSLSLPTSMVELDAPTLERVEREAQRLRELFRLAREEKLWQGAFLRPVTGEVTSDFGLRRIINGRPHAPHSGVDLKADAGTPVLASNRGVVALVDDLFFSGISVILDHGWGLYSMYFHLAEALVRHGEVISKGTVLGRVGSTGRSTAPHLHWGIRIQGARVDPFSLLRSTQSLGESPRGSIAPEGPWRIAGTGPQSGKGGFISSDPVAAIG